MISSAIVVLLWFVSSWRKIDYSCRFFRVRVYDGWNDAFFFFPPRDQIDQRFFSSGWTVEQANGQLPSLFFSFSECPTIVVDQTSSIRQVVRFHLPFYLYLLLIWGVSLVYGRFLRRRPSCSSGRCIYCGYDLHGNTSGPCPECGKPLVLEPINIQPHEDFR